MAAPPTANTVRSEMLHSLRSQSIEDVSPGDMPGTPKALPV